MYGEVEWRLGNIPVLAVMFGLLAFEDGGDIIV
jgi:hypothetical protein